MKRWQIVKVLEIELDTIPYDYVFNHKFQLQSMKYVI